MRLKYKREKEVKIPDIIATFSYVSRDISARNTTLTCMQELLLRLELQANVLFVTYQKCDLRLCNMPVKVLTDLYLCLLSVLAKIPQNKQGKL